MRLKVFMVMPFQNELANANYDHSIKPTCISLNLDIQRADNIFKTNPIYDDIVKEIQESSIIIVDITGKNPNVFYELGMAHTLKQGRTIMVTQDPFEGTPFDIAHFRIIQYEDSIVGKSRFESHLKTTLQNLLSDFKETFKDEFELTTNIFLSAKQQFHLIGLVGLANYKGILNIQDRCEFEGTYPGGEQSHASISIEDSFKALKSLGYVSFENSILSLTAKGQAFAEVLIEKGITCNMFNRHKFDQNYKAIRERRLNNGA